MKMSRPWNVAVTASSQVTIKALLLQNPPVKPAGKLRTWPWFENRGSNPYLLVTGQAGRSAEDGKRKRARRLSQHGPPREARLRHARHERRAP